MTEKTFVFTADIRFDAEHEEDALMQLAQFFSVKALGMPARFVYDGAITVTPELELPMIQPYEHPRVH